MKSFLHKVFFFLLVILATCIIIEGMIRMIPNEYRLKKEYLDINSDTIEVLFLGASDAHAGFNPELLDRKSFNAAHPAQSLDYCYAILNEYDGSWSKLDNIVLTYSYPTLYYKLKNSNEAWRVKNYTIYYKMANSRDIKSHVEILNGQLFEHFLRIYNYYIQGVDEIQCNDLGWYISSKIETPESLEISGSKASERHTVPLEQQSITEMRNALDSIVSFSKRHQCEIIFCSTPAYKSYRESFDNYQFDSTIHTIQRIAKENVNCTYINLLEDPRFTYEDYLDGDHLNSNGARKLTFTLDSILNLE